MKTPLLASGIASLFLLAGCFGPPAPRAPLEFVGPYRGPGDACLLVSDTPYTDRFRGLRGDLVACPATMPRLDRFAAETHAIAVDRVAGYVLYAIPAG